MHPRLGAAAVLAAFALAACGTPSAVAPTLSDLDALGYRCDTHGSKGNEPNDLYQWQCRTPADDDPARGVYVEGNDRGVSSILLYVDSEDPEDARAAFAAIAVAVRPLSTRTELAGPIQAWKGPQEWWDLDGVRLSAECSAGECRVGVSPVAGPLVPLPLP